MNGAIGLILILAAVILATLLTAAARQKRSQEPVSSDGHAVPEKQDLTCFRFGHTHEDSSAEFGSRYIVHNDPEEGYVILNGIKRRITDCRNL